MARIAARTFDQVDETIPFDHGHADTVHPETASMTQRWFEPGWRWSTQIKPLVGTESCQAHHIGYALSGTLRVVADDGEEMEIRAGQAYEVLPGHDGWVVGDETFRGMEFDRAAAEPNGAR